ncbi:18208_t:CDS:2, partial [Gigaspora rosea]
MLNVSSSNFNRGLIINAQGIQFSDFISFDIKPQYKVDSIENTSFHAKIVNSTTKKESFLLKNHIEVTANDLEHVRQLCQIFNTDETINSAMTLLDDESYTNDIFLMVQCAKVELIIKQETIKPSDELSNKVKEALKHHDPYNELVNVFNNYGYCLPKKIILGYKIYGMTYLTVDKDLSEPIDKTNDLEWIPLNDFSENKLDDIPSSYQFDLSYFVSVNGELIMKNKIEEWIKFCLESDRDSLQVIGCKELYPLYEIFDLSLRQEIETILGVSRPTELTISNQYESIDRNKIKERVLIAGVIPIEDSSYSYSVTFPVCFKSNNYQVFGKFITRDGEPIDEFTYMNPKIAWILIGIPAEVGYFSQSTRKINVLDSGNNQFALKPNNNNIILEVPENLPKDSVIVVSFKHPPSHYEPKLIATLKSYQHNKILFNINCHDYEPSDSDENSEDSKSFNDEEVNEDSKLLNDESGNKDSKSFDDEGGEDITSNQKLIIESSSASDKEKVKYSNKDLKTDDIEFVHKNRENVIGEGSKDVKSNYNEN